MPTLTPFRLVVTALVAVFLLAGLDKAGAIHLREQPPQNPMAFHPDVR